VKSAAVIQPGTGGVFSTETALKAKINQNDILHPQTELNASPKHETDQFYGIK